MRIFCVFIFFVSLQAHSQSALDSLKALLHDRKELSEDTLTFQLLMDLSVAFRYDNADSSLHYALLAEQYATGMAYARGKGDAITSQGVAYYIIGAYDQSLTAHTQALEIHKETENQGGLALSFNGIALVYLGQEDYERTIPYLRQAIAINTRAKDSTLLSNNFFNMGIVYDQNEAFDSARYYLEWAEAIADKVGNYRTKLMVNNRMAEMLYRQGQFESALEQYTEVLNASYYQSNWETTFAYAGLAQTHLRLGDAKSAVDAGKRAVEYAYLVGAHWDIERALKILAEAYAASGDFENAYVTHTKYKAYSDTLFNVGKETEINYLFLKQKEAENRELVSENELKEQQIRQSHLTNIIFVVVVLSMLIIGFILVRGSRAKEKLNQSLQQKNDDIKKQNEYIEKQNQKLAKLNETNALILSILSHDLRSPVASIQSMMELFKGGGVSAHEQREVFSELEKRIDNIAGMMNSLLSWAGAQFSGVKPSFAPVIMSDIVSQVLAVFEHRLLQKGINVIHGNAVSEEVLADPSQVRIVVQNLISNAIKFTPGGGTIEVYYSVQDVFLSVHIKDSGVGMDIKRLTSIKNTTSERITELGTEQEPGTGLGLILVRQFVTYNNGKLDIRSEQGKGSEFIVSLPLYR